MPVINLIKLAKQNGIHLKPSREITAEAIDLILRDQGYSVAEIKENFDTLLDEIQQKAHDLYLDYERKYAEQVFEVFGQELIARAEISDLSQIGEVLSRHFNTLDSFFMSMAQSRRSRAGSTFEDICKMLFKTLNYPFDEQQVINGKPDFIMPSADHYRRNAMDCIIFTSKRTLRERWRQVVTEGTRGLVFYLATIDDKVSENTLKEMLQNRVVLVCPARIRIDRYADKDNVISFTQFFSDVVDPAVERWRRNGVIR